MDPNATQHDIQVAWDPLDQLEGLESRQHSEVTLGVAIIIKALLGSYFFLIYILAFLLFLTYILFLCAL